MGEEIGIRDRLRTGEFREQNGGAICECDFDSVSHVVDEIVF